MSDAWPFMLFMGLVVYLLLRPPSADEMRYKERIIEKATELTKQIEKQCVSKEEYQKLLERVKKLEEKR